jgi:hypothetical protein
VRACVRAWGTADFDARAAGASGEITAGAAAAATWLVLSGAVSNAFTHSDIEPYLDSACTRAPLSIFLCPHPIHLFIDVLILLQTCMRDRCLFYHIMIIYLAHVYDTISAICEYHKYHIVCILNIRLLTLR